MTRKAGRAQAWVLHAEHLLGPMARTATRLGLERSAQLRRQRLADAARDRQRQRRRPTRPYMRALSVEPGGRFSWRTVASPPPPGPDGALVHPIAVASCDLDRALALGRSPFPLPLHFGHECVAEVLEVGDHVASVSRGQRVVVPFQISCGRCGRCLTGHTGSCTTVPPISMYGFGIGGGHWGGAFSDVLAVPYADAMLVPLPEQISPAHAASVADNVGDAHRHVAPHLPAILRDDPDAAVLLIGAVHERSLLSPSVPLYAGLIARMLGARQVMMVDVRAHVLAHAERIGLIAVPLRELTDVGRAALVVESSGSPHGLRVALRAAANDGICTSSGGLHNSTRIPTGLLYGRNITFHLGRAHARTQIPHVLNMMIDGLRPEAVTTHTGRIDDAPLCLREHVHHNATKTILVE